MPITLKELEIDHLSWARPHVERARSDVNRGDVLDGNNVIQRLRSQPAD